MVDAQLSNVVRQIRKLAGVENSRDLTDQQLLHVFCQNGDEHAFAALLKRHGPMVLGVCRHVLGHEQDAEDAFQATFLVLARKAASVRRGEALINWLHGVAFRMAMNMKRNAARRREHEARITNRTGLSPSAEVAWREVQAVLEEEIARLPQKHRAPFLLCCVQTMTRAEAARRLGVKEGTVWSRLAHARQLLQARLTRRGVSLSAVLAAAALSPASAQAAQLYLLASATLKAALRYAASSKGVPVSAKVVALANGASKAMVTSKVKLATVLILAAGLVATGARATLYHAAGAPQAPSSPREEVKVPPAAKEPDPSVARIAGTVVDEGGKPVAAAVIRTLAPGPATRSAADGSFLLALEQPAARYVTVLASVEEGARQGLTAIVDTNSPLGPVANVRIVLKPSRALTVRVTDSKGKPVRSADVAVFDSSCSSVTGGVTDADGAACVRVPADAQVLWVVAMKRGTGFDYFENYRSWPGIVADVLPAKVSLVLEGARTVRIRATDSTGQPLPGVPLRPWTIHKTGKLAYANLGASEFLKDFSSSADQQGIATFDWIPKDLKEGNEGFITFLSTSQEYHLPEPPHFDSSHQDNPLIARFLKNTRAEGKITLPDGKPAAGILVQAEGRGATAHYCRTLARSRADGRYSLLLYPEQSHIIAVTDDNWAAPAHVGLKVGEGESRKNLDFRLVKGTLIYGDVTVGPKEKPATEQTITLVQVEGPGKAGPAEGLVRWTSSDKAGRYRIRVGPGTYQISAPGTNETITVQNEAKLEMNFHTSPLPRGLLSGTVLAKNVHGATVPRAIIQGEYIGIIGGFQAVADDTGRFQTERWRYRMHLYARDPQGTLAGFLTIGEEDDDTRFVIAPAAKVKGRLLDVNGKPQLGVRVVAWMTKGPQEALEGRGSSETKTDKEGSFTLGGLVPGCRCTVRADSGGGESPIINELAVLEAKTIDLGDLTVGQQ